jgi:O-antigen ligase
MLVLGFGFLVFIQVLSPGLLQTFVNLFRNAGNDPSIQYRTHDYATAHHLISLRPWLGRGIGTWYAPKHEVFDNQYLLTLVDTGVIGLVSLLAITVAAVYSALRVIWLVHQHSDLLPGRDRDLALALVASLSAVLPSYATFDFHAFVVVSSLSYLLAGICGAFLRIVHAEVTHAPVDEYAVT